MRTIILLEHYKRGLDSQLSGQNTRTIIYRFSFSHLTDHHRQALQSGESSLLTTLCEFCIHLDGVEQAACVNSVKEDWLGYPFLREWSYSSVIVKRSKPLKWKVGLSLGRSKQVVCHKEGVWSQEEDVLIREFVTKRSCTASTWLTCPLVGMCKAHMGSVELEQEDRSLLASSTHTSLPKGYVLLNLPADTKMTIGHFHILSIVSLYFLSFFSLLVLLNLNSLS